MAALSTAGGALADNKAGTPSVGFQPPPELAGHWRGDGVYELQAAGIRVHVKPGQHFIDLQDKPFAAYRRCRTHIQALVHDPKLGLLLIGRYDARQTVVDDWDDRASSAFPIMLEMHREQHGTGWPRLPVTAADFYSPPTYDPSTYRARWIFSFVSGKEPWFSSYWFSFDRDGYIVVALMSRRAGLDGLDAAMNASLAAPIEVQNLGQHDVPLPPPGDPMDYTTAFMAVMAEPVIGACQFQTPFGDSY